LLKRNDLIAEIYGDDPDGINDEALTALVARLRRKVEKAGFGTIEALRGQGYRFAPNLLRVS
jgi:DNA-binding response OmpR family regulator